MYIYIYTYMTHQYTYSCSPVNTLYICSRLQLIILITRLVRGVMTVCFAWSLVRVLLRCVAQILLEIKVTSVTGMDEA